MDREIVTILGIFLLIYLYLRTSTQIKRKWQNQDHLGDNCIQNFRLGRYMVGYTVGNLVLRRHASGAVKRDFRTYIRQNTSPNENLKYGYSHYNALLQFCLNF